MSQSSGSDQLLPDLRKEIEVSVYIFAGSTAVFVWDILNNLHSDYSLLFKHRLNAATLAYFVSRIASFAYVLGSTIFACESLYSALSAFFPIGVSGTAFLFFIRVRAIFNGERMPTIIFGCLWLAVLASSIANSTTGRAIGLGNPTLCVVALQHVPPALLGLVGIAITMHDTIVFLAISYRLISNVQAEPQTPWEQFKALFSGADLPAFSKSLFMDGQMYYMIAVVVNIATTVVAYAPVSPVYRSLLVIPSVTITCIMACRVYRNVKLGVTHRNGDFMLPTLNTGNTILPTFVQFSAEHTVELHIGANHSDYTEQERNIHLHLASRGKNSNHSAPSPSNDIL
ncbi:hypothetical protein B0H16DRAFT_1314327 [Mycena metata]|uniref:Uncharacterized protein n=1 Tax=Mycena metata TaxID=1033252 RepID=A0AAD7J671_9AGAR|nr:hypothetical protein B0H16DRAFT_1314327 [Mycena metata]